MPTDALCDELAVAIGAREARWVLEEVDRQGRVGADRDRAAHALVARRRAGEPLQYVLGHWPFRGIDLLVRPAALIPRPETEALTGLAVARALELDRAAVVCDLGCGTGAIALSVAVELSAAGRAAKVHAVDVAPEALDLARRNAARLGCAGVAFHLGSWYDALPRSLVHAVDVVCANPPYVSASERPRLARELDFEPDLALVATDGSDGTGGFAAVEGVIAGAGRWLAPGGTLLVEHGAAHRDAATRLAARCGLELVADHADLAGLPRILEARSPA